MRSRLSFVLLVSTLMASLSNSVAASSTKRFATMFDDSVFACMLLTELEAKHM